jgi:DNA invertase Pin-like site-specific DNA recombinase
VLEESLIRAALYARVSTHAGQNPEMQLAELREYCDRRGWDIVGEYVDTGVSGARERRPELDRMLTACRRRNIDAVVVYRYDRFARSLRQLVNALEDFRAVGIQFVSIHEGVDTSTPNGRLVFGIFASIAEFERELIRDRVRSGIAAAIARGKHIGRPRRPVDTARVLELRGQGWSWSAIAKEVGAGLGTVHRAAQKATASNSQIQFCRSAAFGTANLRRPGDLVRSSIRAEKQPFRPASPDCQIT